MPRFHIVHKDRLFQLFVALFMTLNLSIIAVTGLGYSYTVHTFDRIVTDFNVSTIENISTTLSTRFSAGEKLSQELYHTVRMGELPGKKNFDSPTDKYAALNLIRSLQYSVDSNDYLSGAYLYLFDSDTIISNTGLYDAEIFYQTRVPHSGLNFEEWKTFLLGQNQPTYQSAMLEVDAIGTAYDIIEYYHPFNAYSSDHRGCIILNYDKSRIRSFITSNKMMEDSTFQVQYLPAREIVYFYGSAALGEPLDSPELEAGSSSVKQKIGDKSITLQQVSKDSNWKFTITVPGDIFFSRASFFVRIIILFVFLQILIGVLLAFLFSMRSYRPIQAMLGRLRHLTKEYEVAASIQEFSQIEQVTHHILEDHLRLRSELEKLQPIVLRSSLLQIINGNRGDRNYALDLTYQLSDYFPQQGFVCAKILIEDNSEFVKDNSLSEMQLSRLVISNVAEELLGEYCTTVSLEYDIRNIVLVFNVPWSEDTQEMQNTLKQIETLLGKSQAIIAEKFKIYTSIGLGYPLQGIFSLHKGHLQAERALQNKPISDVYGLNLYDKHLDGGKSYSYSLETEIYLLNSAKAGNYPAVCKLLDTLAEENAPVFSAKSNTISLCFMMDLCGTLLRLCEELSIPRDILEIDISKLLVSRSGNTILQQIYKYYEDICNWVNRNKKSHNDKMKDQILEYIHQHCYDNSMSLVSVADHIGINSTYLSTFIKEQMGETFLNYVLNLRMERAKELLSTTTLSLQEIAVQIGYANSGVFLRVFKKKYGLTPGAYRKQHIE